MNSFDNFESTENNQIVARFKPRHDPAQISCFHCGKPVTSNGCSLCNECIALSVDITGDLEKTSDITFCKHCGRLQVPPNKWVYAERESRELMQVCLKRLRNLDSSEHRLIDAKFLWTEPHSRRTKLKITVQGEAKEFNNLLIQQAYEVEFFEHTNQCRDCAKSYTAHTWQASIQVRQKVEHKKTFLHLEQLILKHGMHQKTNNIQESRDGIDFFFGSKADAVEMLDFLASVVPIKTKKSAQFISEDTHTAKKTYKFTYSVEIAPICRDDLVILPRSITKARGNGISPLVVCYKVNSNIYVIDPDTLKVLMTTGAEYWRSPFSSLATARGLTEYIVLDSELNGRSNDKFVGADITVAKAADLGVNDTQYVVRTHMGALLHPGDSVMGYDLTTTNFNDAEWDKLSADAIPDVILVKKVYPDKVKSKPRRLQRMAKEYNDEVAQSKPNRGNDGKDYDEFLEDLEDDEYREEVLPDDEELPDDEILDPNDVEQEVN